MGAFAIFSRPIRQKEIFKHEKQHSKKKVDQTKQGQIVLSASRYYFLWNGESVPLPAIGEDAG